jgi:Flp pilus assembly protein TadG
MKRVAFRKSFKDFARARAGAAGMEFAIIMPLMLVLMIGAIEIGRAMHSYHVVNTSTRDAARFLSRQPMTACPGANFVDLVDRTDAVAIAMTGNRAAASQGNLLGHWDHSDPLDRNDVTITVTCVSTGTDIQGIFNGVTEVPVIDVTATFDFPYLFGTFIAPSAVSQFTLSHRIVGIGE